MNKPLLLPIAEITEENIAVKTFWFSHSLNSQPGQFVMLWIPGLDQKPFSIAYDTGNKFGLSIFAVGPLSKKLFEMKPGDRVGISGPYGHGFSVRPNTRYIMVGGGYGAGPLGVLAERASAIGSAVDFCVGARTGNLLLFEERAKQIPNTTVHVATDDGSRGHKGYVTDILEKLLQENIKTQKHKNIVVATCGPELMEKKILDLCNQYDVECEISIERYMKCGFGVCGQCCTDDLGIRMCVEGPVVSRAVANQLSEFGIYHRDKAGTKQYSRLMITPQQIATLLLNKQAVALRVNPPYTWTSGIKAPIYCDNRLMISFPAERKQIVAGLKQLIAQNNLQFDVIAGTATAAVPWASFLAYDLGKPMVYIRHKSKDYGAGKNIEGKMEKGARVLIVEDLISTGGSAVRSVEACRTEYNADVVAVLAIFTYEMEQSVKAFSDAGVPLYTLSNFSTLVNTAVETGYLTPTDRELVLAWSKDPEGWATTLSTN